MKIRQEHSIKDRIKLIILLLLVMIVLGRLAKVMEEKGIKEKQSTIENFLRTALQPVGFTMYIWGGGWDGTDQEAGASSTQLGLSEQWKDFAQKQDETYDFNQHRYEREKGLDCSGYVGWTLYNTFETEEGKEGYVSLSTEMAESLAKRGWGKLIKNPKEFLPGDIVSMEGHVWICLGTCKDGSVLLVHSSPPGVSVCGTILGDKSDAASLATEYMESQHPDWQEKYPNRGVEGFYLENVVLFRWSESIMEDAEHIQRKSAEEIMGILLPDIIKNDSIVASFY